MTNSSLILVRSNPDNPAGEVCDLQTLKAWVRDGTVTREQLIFDPQTQQWIPAYQFGPLSAIFTQQLWDAWEESDIFAVRSGSSQSKISTEETESVPDLSTADNTNTKSQIPRRGDDLKISHTDKSASARSTPKESFSQKAKTTDDDPIAEVLAMFDVPAPTSEDSEEEIFNILDEKLTVTDEKPKRARRDSKKQAVEELPLSALEPLETKPPKPKTSLKKSSSVVQPRRKIKKVNRSQPNVLRKPIQPPSTLSMDHASAFRLPLTHQQPVRRPPHEPSGIRWGRIFMIIAPFVMLFLIFRWYVGSTATAQFPTSEDLDQTPSQQASGLNLLGDGVADPYFELDTELRSKLRPTCLSITPETLVEDIMTVELDALNVDVIGIRASIVEWTGRNLDRPKTATFRFRLKGGETFEYELAAVALIVGKYMENYVMDVAKLDVTIDTHEKSMQFELEPDLAGRYFRSNVGIGELLTSQ